MEKSIAIKSSSSEGIYNVVFKIDKDLISINCNCQAGIMKTLCKHRLDLINGDVSAILDEADISKLTEFLNLIEKSKIPNLYLELNRIESEIKRLNTLKTKMRKEIGFMFSNGF
ncbi:hypothetical protein SAMN05443549_102305 [Flavobacterium fluvii]|uniref:SWIM-type domain-containing protein n=1 Tax=Flavobacterium fluvii TaxID=468056 RepID=A0A1M5HN81_9FLAO|nr:hypothetical protein [Flavobacterium fluvii]SHG17377.1 hypothetical protein SAMN05443549_102305 [Flavobacterium fluvii]